jgi:hypothetical protein
LARKNIYYELFTFCCCIIRQATLEEGLGYLREAQEIEECIEPFKEIPFLPFPERYTMG